ncbi:MAG: winged helix-turn-helix transcriptional regulator [Actinomycetota bacterium]|nr:winged helix-turn-helix transcriptional regulator [Actinomycetota bacterium]
MPTTRSYGDACSIARALDVVGERWALLVVRELVLGPQRFSDLRRSLPGAASNVVTDRLRELESHGVVRRRTLPPPAASSVYELTTWGRDLEPILFALGNWAMDVPLPPSPTLSATSVLLFLRAAARPDPNAAAAVYQLDLDERGWTVRTEDGRLHVDPGEPVEPDAVLRTDPVSLNALLEDPSVLDDAVREGKAEVAGDRAALRGLLESVAA